MPYRKLTFILFSLLFFNALTSTAQQKDKDRILSILKSSQQKYESLASFELKTNYKSFVSYTSSSVSEHYEGHYIKNKKHYYTRIGAIEFACIDGYTISIDNNTRLLGYQKSTTDSGAASFFKMEQHLTHFTDFLLVDEGDFWVCTLSSKNEILFIPYSKIIIKVDKRNYLIKEQTL
jgi:hypothetical protein